MAKSVKFYLIRHGATDFNAVGGSPDLIRGWIDIPLNKIGKDQAAKMAEMLADSKIKRIFCSDLIRAKQTAEALGKTTGAPITPTKGLRPWDLGRFTGQSYETIREQVTSYAKNKPDQKVPGGESFNTFLHRAFGGIHTCLEDAEDEDTALVSHHRDERLFKAWVNAGELPRAEFDWATFLKRGEPTGKWELLECNLTNLAKAATARGKRWEDEVKGEVVL